MLNQYSRWKYVAILIALLTAMIYVAPNFFSEAPSVQVSGSDSTVALDRSLLTKLEDDLRSQRIEVVSAELTKTGILFHFSTPAQQRAALEQLQMWLGNSYVVALAQTPMTPGWLKSIGGKPLNLGLDLSGGVHFLLEVDVEAAVVQRMEVYQDELNHLFRQEKLRYKKFSHINEHTLSVYFETEGMLNESRWLLSKKYPQLRLKTDIQSQLALIIQLSDVEIRDIERIAINQNLTTIRNRVNELGVSEPLVQRQGHNRIVVELPGVKDSAAAKRILGKTANLEFRLEAKPDASLASTESFPFRDNPQRSAVLERNVIMTGSNVANAQSNFGETGQAQVSITLDSAGAKMMQRATRDAVLRRMGALFIEYKQPGSDGRQSGGAQAPVINKQIISLATIQSALGSQFRITGLSNTEASELALLLRSGSLAAPVYIVEERTVGPSLGQHSINLGLTSMGVGFGLVVLFMLLYYQAFGLIANLALGLNVLVLVAALSALSATLTLPGIAGIVLTVGMAVDANVLIFSRIKEELKSGLSPQSAINAGFERAFGTIFDSNITTLLVALILFAVGTGPVKGFAVTLSLGILSSMFTAVIVTRALVNLVYGGRHLKRLPIGWEV
mgnify:CR=1 FL=1